jgi:hypothetical protein
MNCGEKIPATGLFGLVVRRWKSIADGGMYDDEAKE